MTTTTDKNYQQVFILITIEDTYIKILKLLSPFPSLIPEVTSSFSFNKYIEQKVDEKMRKKVFRI